VKVIREPVLLDTGPLVALLNRRDQHPEICSQQAKQIQGRVLTSWTTVTEAAWLLRLQPGGLAGVLQAIDDQDIHCVHLKPESVPWMIDCAKQYRDLNPQLADVSLLYLAQRHGIDRIFTLDRRDFLVYRTAANAPFVLLPDSL
jgi:uncharacterized protein